ncbi:MAG: hypothetical protein U9N84_00375 [Actinomycetota bacterium]|nr:hypothetical protein [Actinomycetota bacterium]
MEEQVSEGTDRETGPYRHRDRDPGACADDPPGAATFRLSGTSVPLGTRHRGFDSDDNLPELRL